VLGTLAASMPACVAAVGPRAALAGARPDGTVAHYDTVDHFLGDGPATPCPLTLVDAGQQSDKIITALADRPYVTVVVTGIGPPAGSDDPSLQALYMLPATAAGWLTSASTRRDGIVNLTDLTATLIAVGRRDVAGRPAPVDGSPFEVRTEVVSATAAQDHLEAVAALSNAAVRADAVLGVSGAILLVVLIVSVAARRFAVARPILGWGTILPVAMLLTGAMPWNATRWPVLVLLVALAGWGIALTVLVFAGARRLNVPFAVAGAAVTVTAFTVDAALGGVMEPGSMLNSRPVNGGRWYGFGNVTFAVYAATLVLVGYLAHRLRATGHRRAALVSVAVIGFGVVVCEGWPSMGAEFSGVIALTPALLWLLLVLADIPITWPKLVVAAASALLLVAAISWLDWLRGPTARTHLGGFFQRVLDGDALNIIIRKAVAAAGSMLNPLGMGAVLVGVVVWVFLFRRLLPALRTEFTTLHMVAVAALGVAILGTAVNDGGITVWYTVTLAFTMTVSALWVDRTSHLSVIHQAARQGGAADRLSVS
jgi:hypothetical protein